MKKLISAMLIIAMLLGVCALAEVKTTGNVNLRTGPGLAYDVLTSVSKGKSLTYLKQTSIDDRGIAWYLVEHKGTECWISSVYSEVVGEPVADPAQPEQPEVPELPVLLIPQEDPAAEGEYIEVSEFYLQDLQSIVELLGLSLYSEGDEDTITLYTNEEESIFIGGFDRVTHIEFLSEEYSMYGANVTMSAKEVYNSMFGEDIIYLPDEEQSNMYVYGHLAGPDSMLSVDGFDSQICVCKTGNKVTGFVWYSYGKPE